MFFFFSNRLGCAEALKPVAGAFAEFNFALGIVGTVLLAVPVLAGSYAIGDGLKWPVGLSRKPKESIAFYSVLALSVGLGVLLNFTPASTRSRRSIGAGRQRRSGGASYGDHDATGAPQVRDRRTGGEGVGVLPRLDSDDRDGFCIFGMAASFWM